MSGRPTGEAFGKGAADGRGWPFRWTALAFTFGAFLCSAASADVQLSNLGESNDVGITVGTPVDSPINRDSQAIRFQTGTNERGYNLTSVKAILANAADSDGVRVRIFNARSNGNPYYSLYTLTNPVISDGTLTFTAPASATLQKATRYFVLFDSTASGAGNDYEVSGTVSDTLATEAEGWSLNTDRHVGPPDSLFWRTHDEVPLVEISGDALVRANDANLSAISITDRNGSRTGHSPRFDPSMTSYTSTADTLVDQITINATPANADGAEVAYLDGDDQLRTDADADTEGFQVDLTVGANPIKVQVTAEDGSTTRTYTVVVTRKASRVSADALASNLDEHFSKRFYVGNLEPGKTLRAQALGFETGGNEAGYVLTAVKILIWEITHSAGVRVRIFTSTAEGNPDTSLYTLSGSVVLPTSDQAPEDSSPTSTFEAPANATLEPNTRYFVMLDSKFLQMYRYYKIWGTKSDTISKVADGWSMNDYRHTGIRDSGVWTTADEVPFVDVADHAVVPSSDASLSALDLTWDDSGTETAIALSPLFNASTTAYTAAVANGVDQITVKETKGDSGARVDYLDGADSTLTDADGNATGFQVDLGVGANTIKAKVAASDGETTGTYTVVVTRAAGDTTAPSVTGATVDGATLAIAFDETLAAAANLANGAFAVKKTPSGGSEVSVALGTSPSISGTTVTLTLAAAVASTDAVTVSYTRPVSGTANRLEDAAGNEVADFADQAATNNTVAVLRAWFQNVPDEHDGASVFTLELAFSEAVFDGTESFDKNQAIQNALEVTGGTVRGRQRIERNAYDRWLLRIGPAGNGDVTVELPATTAACGSAGAVCTPDGRPLTAPASTTVQGPPALSVADVEVEESPGASLGFVVTLGRAATAAASVQYATADDSATAGLDYTATSGTLAFAVGESEKTVSVPVLDDSIHEGDEALTFALSNASGAWIEDTDATGTIEDDDPAPQAPDAPSAPTLTAGTTWLEASWTAPADNGSAITGYDVHYRTSGGNWTDADHTGTSTTKRIEGLSADTAYEVRVRASNTEGAGDWSASASARTDAAAEAPDAPSAPTLTAGTTWLEASWTAPADNGSAITGYDVHYRTSGGNWTDASHTGTSPTKRIQGLSADTVYEVRVRATNAEGTGDWSASASARTASSDGASEGDVRLVGGTTAQQGRVEIHHNGEWGTVCDDRFVSDDAEVVCRQLGYTGGQAHTRAAFGAGTGTIWMDDVQCTGGESRLADCPFGGWGLHNCRHSEDVGVSCGAASGNALANAAVSGAVLTLRFDRPLDRGSVPSPRDFVVAAGTPQAVIPVASVAVPDGEVVLTLSRPIERSEDASVSYLPGAMHPLQDASYNPVPALTDRPVRHALRVDRGAEPAVPPETGSWGAAKVEVLDLSSRGLSDVSWLAGLADVEVLDLGGNRVADLWPMAAMAGLEVLDLGDNAVADLSPLAGLPHLRVLDLSGNAVSDLTPLSGLTRLRRLDLSGNRVDDLRPLSELRGLKVLLLDGNRVADLVPLWGLRELAHLSLADNGLADVALLGETRSLLRLDLAGNALRDATVLGDLPNVAWLRVSGNPIADVSPLGRLTSLRWLGLNAGVVRADDQAPVLVIKTRRMTGATQGSTPAHDAVTHLTLGEEILLLLVEEDTADLRPVPPWSMACALAGATLMELSMQGRVDTDRHDLTLLNETPTDCEPLDSALAEIAATTSRTTRHWLEFLAERSEDAREGYLRELSERGFAVAGREDVLDRIAEEAERGGTAVVDVDVARRDLRLRILRCLLTAEIPDARDVMTVCLADACGVLRGMLPGVALEGVRSRIGLMRQMDQIGRTITEAIWELDPPVTPRPRAGKPIPEVPGLPLVGSGIGVAKDLPGFLMRQYRRLGPVFGLRLPGRRYVVMAGVDANRLMLRRGKELFHSAYGWHGFAAGFGASRMMIGMDGREHVRLRRAHRKGYARTALTGRTPDLMRIVRAEIQGWNGKPVPVVASVRRMVTEQLGTVVAGFSPRNYEDDLGRVLRGLLMAKMLGAAPRAWLWTRSYRRAHARVRELADRVWNAHLERPEHMPRDLVDDLLELHAEDPQFLPETDLSVAMLGPFFAGLDTVTAAVSFSLHGLLGHPDLLREATREVDEAFAGGTPTEEQFDALDVTRRVVMEALRLYPVSPVTLRRAVNAFEFAGHVIPAGQELMIAFTLPHQLAEVFPDPLRFDIGRFSDSRGEHRKPGAYAPFGLGMHRCLGGNLAESLVVATIAGILRHARLAPYPANYKLRVKQFPTVIPDGRFRMRATARGR